MHGLEPLNTDIDGFREAVDYHSHRLRNLSLFLQPRTDPTLHEMKRQIELLYPTIGIFDGKDMETLFATIRDAFDDHNISKALATRALGFFLSEAAKTAYHSVVDSGTQDPMHYPLS